MAGAGYAHAQNLLAREGGEQLVQQRLRGLRGAALDALVACHQQRLSAGQGRLAVHGVEELRVTGEKLLEKAGVGLIAEERELQADAADVYAEECHGVRGIRLLERPAARGGPAGAKS